MDKNTQALIDALKDDLLDELPMQKHEIQTTIDNIFKQYNLRTDLDFVEKIGKINFGKDGEVLALDDIPQELTDAAFVPPNAISDIALRNDIDLVISQVPEKFACIKVTTDAICEADTVDGSIARQLLFEGTEDDDELNNKIRTVEAFEEKLSLQDIIKNHIVHDSLKYGEGYLYTIPYAKIFSDLYKFKIHGNAEVDTKTRSSLNFSTSYGGNQRLNSIRVGESAVEVILTETSKKDPKDKTKNKLGIFTESEVVELYPSYNAPPSKGSGKTKKNNAVYNTYLEETLLDLQDRISYISEDYDIALPVLEESVHDMLAVYKVKYKEAHEEDTNRVQTFFESVMNDSSKNTPDYSDIENQFRHIKGVYIKVLPATKLIPIRIDRHVVGYYYISDGTRPEEAGQRKNSGLTGYTMRSPTIGYDTFSPDKQMCERLAMKIINNFDMKFMRNNTALHDQIVSILQAHRFNDALMRFIFIPAEHVQKFAINKDGNGKGHSMLEPGLVTSRMYMFLKMYCLLFQINNSAIRVYNLRGSGIDKNYRQYVQETMRKFIARRITANDIFNYKSSMTRISGGSELVMHMGGNDQPPITIDKIEAAESPLNTEFLDSLKTESINADSVPSLMITDKLHDIDFAAEIKEANHRFFSMVGGYKIDLNPAVTKLYRFLMKWETEMTEDDIRNFKFTFKVAAKQQLAVTAEMISSFNSELDLLIKYVLFPDETKPAEGKELSEVSREFGRLLIAKRLPDIDMEEMMEMAELARKKVVEMKSKDKQTDGNMVDDLPEHPDEGGEEELI